MNADIRAIPPCCAKSAHQDGAPGFSSHSEMRRAFARYRRSGDQSPGDDGVAGLVGGLLGFVVEGGFQVFGVEVDFAGGDFFFGCAVEAELADTEAGVA